jgi:hypothetical protein
VIAKLQELQSIARRSAVLESERHRVALGIAGAEAYVSARPQMNALARAYEQRLRARHDRLVEELKALHQLASGRVL